MTRFIGRHRSPTAQAFGHDCRDLATASLDRMAISPHVRRLRELVGHELLVLPSVAALPRDEAGRILLVRITDTHQWATIGGAVEPDESPERAAMREARRRPA